MVSSLIGSTPDDWQEILLGDLCELVAGTSIAEDSYGTVPVVKPRNLVACGYPGLQIAQVVTRQLTGSGTGLQAVTCWLRGPAQLAVSHSSLRSKRAGYSERALSGYGPMTAPPIRFT